METTIGSRIKERRTALHLSVGDLAKKAGLSESLIEKLERDNRGNGTTAVTALALADALGVDVRWLIVADDPALADPADPALTDPRPSPVAA
jgi:transcriptional regulator with XRE-family HTH domain